MKEKQIKNNIPISDEQLDEEFRVNEDEKEFLRLPKSATDYMKVDEEDVQTSKRK